MQRREITFKLNERAIETRIARCGRGTSRDQIKVTASYHEQTTKQRFYAYRASVRDRSRVETVRTEQRKSLI
jgi:hypothetical protein